MPTQNMTIDRSTLGDSLGVVVTGPDGLIKDLRFVKSLFGVRFEFVPNERYLSLINSGRLQPNTWKVPFLFGAWTASKDNPHD